MSKQEMEAIANFHRQMAAQRGEVSAEPSDEKIDPNFGSRKRGKVGDSQPSSGNGLLATPSHPPPGGDYSDKDYAEMYDLIQNDPAQFESMMKVTFL